MKDTILLIDDEPEYRKLLAKLIRLEGFQVIEADNGKTGLEVLQYEDISVVVTDVRLPDVSGLQLLSSIKAISPTCEVLVVTAFGRIEDGVQAIKDGAFDYLVKGDEENRVLNIISQAVEKHSLKQKLEMLSNKLGENSNFDSITGHSKAILEVKNFALRVAQTDTPVLLTGETGTGKEIFARAIHNGGKRSQKPFVAVNCSAIGRDLLESEMFGYKAGAFTGALKNKKGLFEEAHTGTLFLDEIGELDLGLQAKILRAIESNEFIKQGDTKPTHVDVRIISATNRNLEKEIELGRFRADLFFRISVMQISLPPLRDRREDIRTLADNFIKFFAEKMNKQIKTADHAFYSCIERYAFPGNIRELRNIIERSIILSDGNVLLVNLLPKDIQQAHLKPENSDMKLEIVERLHILMVLEQCNGNKTKAAETLGISTVTLYRKLEQYGL